MTLPPLAEVPIRSSLALTRRWVALLSPLFFDRRTLWVTWLAPDGRQSPVLLPIEDVAARPDDQFVRGLLDLASAPLEDDGHVALALCRPGEAVESADDHAWADALSQRLDADLDGSWSLHLAAGGRVEPLQEVRLLFVLRQWTVDGLPRKASR
ncbi:hypothetical protein ACI782_06680 [Geodermatophilus sp. SYSU D00703]